MDNDELESLASEFFSQFISWDSEKINGFVFKVAEYWYLKIQQDAIGIASPRPVIDKHLKKAINEGVVDYAKFAVKFNKLCGADVLRPAGLFDEMKSKFYKVKL